MEALTQYFLNFLEIMETELKLFKLSAAKVFKGIGWFGAGIALLFVGLLLLAWTIFTGLTILLGKVAAGLISACLILLAGGVFLWLGTKSMK